MDQTVTQIYNCELFKQLLVIILAVGNYMNGNTIAGGAFGFRLMGLPKMVDCRSPATSKITLLHYTIQLITQEYPDLLLLPTELQLLHQASRFDIGPIVLELNEEIAPSVESLKGEMEEAKKLDDTLFLSSFEPFYEKAVRSLSETRELARKLNSDFNSLVTYFAEDKKLTFKELVIALDTFCSQFDRAMADNIAFEKQERKRQRLQEVELSKESERGILDNALGNLRRGSKMYIQAKN